MLAIEVTFLLGRYAACDFQSRERSEWPPHPSRLFSALVAAAYESGMGQSARAALLWLESLPQPCIAADEEPAVQTPVTAYVPVNDPTDDLLPQRAARQPRSFPSVVPSVRTGETPSVHFVWPEAAPDGILRSLLANIVANVGYLGSSRTPVSVRLTDAPPEPNWSPDEAGCFTLRVPTRGRLESLEWAHENQLRPPVGAFRRYRRGPQAAPEPEAGIYADMVVFRLTGPAQMEIETTVRLTNALRAAAMRQAQDVLGAVPDVLCGHTPDGDTSTAPHAAYVGLPFVSESQQHADGRLLGLAVVLPRGVPVATARDRLRALARIDHLILAGVGRIGLERTTPDLDLPYNLRQETWARAARRWSSVTPVVFDRFPKRRGRGAEAIMARSCGLVGYPAPAEVAIDRFSPLHGVEPSARFVIHRPSPGGPARPRQYAHVTLTFERPVCGPMLMGAGRHFGLGLFRPLLGDGRDGAS